MEVFYVNSGFNRYISDLRTASRTDKNKTVLVPNFEASHQLSLLRDFQG